MALNIKNAEADRLSREKQRMRPPGMADRLMTIAARYAELPEQDDRGGEEILGFPT